MLYNSEKHLELFEKSFLETVTPEERIEELRHGNVFRYRAKTYRMGNVLECEIFPLWDTRTEARCAKKAKGSKPAQEKLNRRNTQKKISRLVNNNFTGADMWVTFGYSKDRPAPTTKQARRDIVNYLRRLKRWRDKNSLPPLRYMYVTEIADKDGNPVRPHHHVILSGDMDRDFVENEWKGGAYPQARRLRPMDQGLKGLAFYLSKGKKGQKFWAYSKNLKHPKPSIADRKITKRQVESLVIDRNSAPDFFRKAFKGYEFKNTEQDLEIHQSDFVAGAYIYASMYRMKPPPATEKEKSKKKE